MKKWPLIALLPLAACATPQVSPETYMAKRGLNMPTENNIDICRGYGCQFVDHVEYTKADWAKIQKHFKPKAKTAEQERAQIKTAIGEFEKITGAKTGTSEDKKGTFIQTGNFQQDCVDESTTTTSYLTALEGKGIMTFHTTLPPTARVPLIHSGTWPHQTAVIQEKASGQPYVVDSWFHDNGANAEIVPLKQWKDGWRPNERE